MTRILIFILLILSSFALRGQSKYTLNGYITDVQNGEELIGVTVYVNSLKTGTVTNVYGFYALSLPAGSYEITYSSVGYQPQVKQVNLNSDTELNLELAEEVTTIDEVVITDKALDANVSDVNMSRNEVDIKQVKKLPALFGEPDIIKSIQMMPGVVSAGEGTSSFFVRGGSADQNLILIDEAPVYDPSHLFGLFSVFNADVIKDSELYKGGIPARYGGRLSSILEVRTKDGNSKEFGGAAGIGTLASKVMLEGPIKKDKGSFILSGRRSYVDLFLKAADQDNLVHFYDVNAKLNWKQNNKNRYFAAFYLGRDSFSFGDDFGFNWGNATGTIRWNHLFNDRIFSNTSLIVSNFDYGLEITDPTSGLDWDSNLQEFSLKEDLNYFINPRNQLDFGYQVTYRRFSPGEVKPNSDRSIFTARDLPHEYALDHALYLENQQKLTDRFTMVYGLRLSFFQNIGKATVYDYEDPQDNINPTRIDSTRYDSFETIESYMNLEPRFSARYMLNPSSSLKISYNRMVQNTHLIASGTVPIPFNTWSPSNRYLKPQIADQFAAGYFKNLADNKYEVSVESYYKDIQNVTDFADNAQLFFNDDLSTEFRQGKSWSYGAEFMLRKNEGKLTGFVSYTWSKTERKVPGVNQNRSFLANYDRRHVMNMAATYDLNDKWSFGANFTYTTGRPITLPAGRYEYQDYQVDLITERNGYKLPNYHRMDFSATLTPLKNKQRKWKSSWVFSIYNVYSRKNPFTVYTRVESDDDGDVINPNKKEARLISLFPILPSVTYNINF
ncbi:TonB-dependent receptor [Fulvivirga sediminis]|uniref:TonB-dependent receptor n=1 Tax=Fulvivirga sediminis TaxID=2803949 RepID=A0A937F6L1_9BACT|nr:TonB-dependent receptor [Fulvivirga sediminis]MBL3655260.1 TonB-dependent receptor [Fulvivirga sediminis]